MDFSETIAASDLKVGRYRQLIEIMKVREYWRSRSFLYHIFSRFCMFCALLGQDIRWAFTGPLVLWFPVLGWLQQSFLASEILGTLGLAWDFRPYMVKTSQNIFLRKRWAEFHVTWFVALGTPAHRSLFKWWPWSDLDLFYGKVKFGNVGFSIGKQWFFRNYCSLWPESW